MAKMEKSAKDIRIEELEAQVADLQEEAKRMISLHIEMEDRYGKEYRARMHERNAFDGKIAEAKAHTDFLLTQLQVEKNLRKCDQERRRRSLPKFVLISLMAMGLILIPYGLLQGGIICERLAFLIEAPLMMVVSWCYAMIWDRTRK